MALNSQHKRVSKNRVSITYDVETNGAVETKELLLWWESSGIIRVTSKTKKT